MAGKQMASENPVLGSDEEFEAALADLQRDPAPEPEPAEGPVDPFDPDTTQRSPILDSEAVGKFALAVRNRLGIKDARWEAVKPRVIKELESISPLKVTARTLLITTFDCVQRIENAMEVAEGMMRKKGISDHDLIAACRIPPICAKGLKDMMEKALILAEKCSDRKSDNGNGRPKNKPPLMAVQVNNYPASPQQTTARVLDSGDGATNGESRQTG